MEELTNNPTLHHHPAWGVLGFIVAVILHAYGALLSLFTTGVSPATLSWTQEISFILSIIVACATLIFYLKKIFKRNN